MAGLFVSLIRLSHDLVMVQVSGAFLKTVFVAEEGRLLGLERDDSAVRVLEAPWSIYRDLRYGMLGAGHLAHLDPPSCEDFQSQLPSRQAARDHEKDRRVLHCCRCPYHDAYLRRS